MNNRRLLITAFEPFGGETVNPTMLVLNELKEQQSARKHSSCKAQGTGSAAETSDLAYELITAVLPVAFKRVSAQIRELLRTEQPDAVICLGQAGGRAAVTPERIAVNLADARIADNAGFMPEDTPLREEGPAAYFSTLPIKQIVQAISDAGIRASVSNSAGLYVCNCLMYHTLDFLAQERRSIPAGFIHVPYLPEQTANRPEVPCMELTDMTKAIRIAADITMGLERVQSTADTR